MTTSLTIITVEWNKQLMNRDIFGTYVMKKKDSSLAAVLEATYNTKVKTWIINFPDNQKKKKKKEMESIYLI